MARQIRVDQIDDFFRDKIVDLVQATTLEWTARVKKATPVRIVYKGEPTGGGQLRAAWQTKIEKFKKFNSRIIYVKSPSQFPA